MFLWLAALIIGITFLYRSFNWFDDQAFLPPERKRVDGNGGHTQIDFGGQWVMGRMVATGNGRELYHRQRQWEIVWQAYPIADESPLQQEEARLPRSQRKSAHHDEDMRHDADRMMSWFMGEDPKEWKTVGGAAAAPVAQPPGNPLFGIALEKAAADAVTPEVVEKVTKPAIGGPLYPPVHAVMYAPLGAIDRPQRAYRVFQVFSALVVFATGLGVRVLTRGRIWCSVAVPCIFLYPGMRGALDLGQNPTLTLCIIVWGWALAARGYFVAGGMVWGLLAFKPVWALAFLLVPLLMRQWRFFISMSLSGAALVALTLPIVGLESWFHWLKIGQDAAELYKVNDNWIHLSRDLHGIPRRMLHDFTKPESEREKPLTNALAWGLWGVVFGGTVLIYLARGDRKQFTGTSAGFLFIGAYLTCYRFMYYDVLLTAAAFAVLFADPRQLLRTRVFGVSAAPCVAELPAGRELQPPAPQSQPLGARMLGYVNSFPLTILFLLFVVENSLTGMQLEATIGFGYFASPATDGSTGGTTPRLKADTGHRYPIDTFILLALWVWCAWRVWRGESRTGILPVCL